MMLLLPRSDFYLALSRYVPCHTLWTAQVRQATLLNRQAMRVISSVRLEDQGHSNCLLIAHHQDDIFSPIMNVKRKDNLCLQVPGGKSNHKNEEDF
ncbi:hypothetical protein PGT21_014694 [Puccinia graminis f. sp. tritici]|uniref:Uncharacterized protein n=1 Tax=Puccinia graminis f. sp. tritici TaxID=56615 RepID=A0A5B0NCB3_PUCGR|nr:hypothetical protein PGT21_014694 [Puccinia graminis f. sp. tritici]